jgi:hypothetical protein
MNALASYPRGAISLAAAAARPDFTGELLRIDMVGRAYARGSGGSKCCYGLGGVADQDAVGAGAVRAPMPIVPNSRNRPSEKRGGEGRRQAGQGRGSLGRNTMPGL